MRAALLVVFAGCAATRATVSAPGAVEGCPGPSWAPLGELRGSAQVDDLVVPFGTIEEIEVRGVSAPLARTLRGVVATHVGQMLEDAPLRDDLRRLWALGVVSEAHVEIEGTRVAFVVVPRPTIAKVTGRDADALARLKWLAGTPYEPARIARIAAAMQRGFVHDGHVDARVSVLRSTMPSGEVELCVAATPGPRVTIESIRFPGRREVPERALLAAIHGNHPGDIFDATSLEEDRAFVLPNEYYERGMMLARIDAPRTVRTGEKVIISIPIDEGPVFRIGEIDVPLRFAVPTGIAPGDLFVRSKIATAQAMLQEVVGERGVVQIETRLDAEQHRVDLEFVIDWRWPWDALAFWSSRRS